MNATEIQQYLANVIAVVRADNVLSPKEESALLEIRLELKAKKADMNRGEKLAFSSGLPAQERRTLFGQDPEY